MRPRVVLRLIARGAMQRPPSSGSWEGDGCRALYFSAASPAADGDGSLQSRPAGAPGAAASATATTAASAAATAAGSTPAMLEHIAALQQGLAAGALADHITITGYLGQGASGMVYSGEQQEGGRVLYSWHDGMGKGTCMLFERCRIHECL